MRGDLAVVALALAACDRPEPRLICHNANCGGPVDSARDATLPALDASLALRRDGRPPFDGIELDLFWHGAAGDCRFAHDFAEAAPPASAAAERVAAFLATAKPATWRGDRFHLFLDLKSHVGSSVDSPHDADQRILHAACALDVAGAVAAGARAGGQALEVVVTSKTPELLAAVRADERFPRGLGEQVELRLAGVIGIPRPLSPETRPLAEFGSSLGLEVMVYNADFTTQGQYQAIRALGLELAQWMNTTTIEALDGIERYRPDYVLSSEVPLVRAWLEH